MRLNLSNPFAVRTARKKLKYFVISMFFNEKVVCSFVCRSTKDKTVDVDSDISFCF